MPQTILVVDDSPTDLKLMTSALEPRGYRILTAADGDEALEKASSLKPNLIFLDVILPKKNGFQVCRALKTDPVLKSTPIILLTSKSEASDKFWGKKQGADAYITKPFNPMELLLEITYQLGGD